MDYKIIFFAIFTFFGVIFTLRGLFKGKKFNWLYSVSRIIVTVASALIAMVISSSVSWQIAKTLYAELNNQVIAGNEKIAELMEALPTAPEAFKALLATVIAPLLFFVIFLIVKGILSLIVRPICKAFMSIGKKKKGKNKKAEEAVAQAEAAEPVENAETVENAEPVENAEAAEEADESDKVLAEKIADGATVAEEAVEETVAEEPVTEVKKSKKELKKEKKAAKKKAAEEFKSANKKSRIVGAICGAICGFVIYAILLIPFVGTLSTVNSIAKAVVPKEEENTMVTEVMNILDGAADNNGARMVKIMGGDLIYSGMTTYSVNGELISVNEEAKLVKSVIDASLSVKDSETDSEYDANAIREVGKRFEKAKLVPMLTSELLSGASDHWVNGESFCSIKSPVNKESQFATVMNDFLVIMKDSTYDTVKQDITTVANSIAVMVENNALSSIKEQDGLIGLFKNEDLISGVMLELFNNDRMSPLVESFTNMGVTMFADMIEVGEDDVQLYENFAVDMKDAYNQTVAEQTNDVEKLKALSKSVADIYDKYGIKISTGVADCISASMLENLSSTVSEEEIKLMFGAPAKEKSVELVSDILYRIAEKTNKDMTEEELVKVVNTELPQYEISAEERTALVADIAHKMYKDIKKGEFEYKNATVDSAVTLGKNSVCVTLDELTVKGVVIADKESEAHAIAKVFASSIATFDSLTNSNMDDIDGIMVSFGPVLDAFADCESIGEARTKLILTAILQSNKVRGNIGFSLLQATEIASTVNSGGESYTTLLMSLGNTVQVIKISAENGDTTEAVNTLMKDLTPESAKVMQQLSTPETVKNYGVPENSAEEVSGMLSDMFGNMSEAKENGMSDEEYQKESEAVNDLMGIAMSAGKGEAGNGTFGDASTTGKTAVEYVDKAANSTVISKTLVNSVYKDGSETPVKDPLKSDRTLNDSEKTELQEALNTKWSEKLENSSDEKANEEYKKVLVSIGAVLNADVVISGNNVTVK